MSLIIETEEFNGPMDLLLNLVEKEKIDIENVDLAKITNKFIEEVENLKNHSTKDLTDFIYLASTLLYIKSKKLLPKNDFDEDDQIDEDLIKQRLIEYKKFKEISKQLIELENISSKHFRKIQEDLSAYQSEKENLIVTDVNLLSETLLEILNREDNRIVIEETEIIEAEEYKIEDCIEDILWKVEKNRTYSFSSFLSQKTNRNEVISVFLALLELLKSNILKVVKNEDNMEILMR
ncbi:MAG: segregation/condensation protein A [Finegoldia magna]|uniref:segregation and condensation protein A n=1 Tax=Finegoldia magna TaxID=1260 RepID=UPI000B916415|nr:segregation/condensation protein A [Finegoldia magna]MDU1010377.1 segregation/condensation protein A [Finegoldia magna]MDU1087709.1 segregation/condensation protein A [Finegoldia magna]MDU7890856.1 segregation/condensation protein A [Finegoldia magna]MDU7926004.1 segregation/condensation protein A [Finegoldia magna]OXZ38733.1 chromosome segregation protein ScpA [Finegoldia magna]